MIQIAGITLPQQAFWVNEIEHGLPVSKPVECIDGSTVIFSSAGSSVIEIYMPKVAGELTRQTVIQLKELAESGVQMHVQIGDTETQAVFDNNGLQLKPIQAKQQYEPEDSYYGTIRLLEV